jgi:CDP-diacylglycerol--glycerol-3-phosphate 3-phosphatidyltransferase
VTEVAAAKTWFGPSAVLTPANLVTIGRLLISPLLLFFIVDDVGSWPAVTLWIALAATDGVDGWLARRHGTTRSGAFLDPLADKVLVLGAMVALVAADRWPLWPVAIIAVRELGIQAFRSFWARRGLAVPASTLAKVKTVIQEVAVGLCLLPLTEDARWVGDAALGAALTLTLITGAQYIHAGSRVTRTGGSRSAA